MLQRREGELRILFQLVTPDWEVLQNKDKNPGLSGTQSEP